MAFNINPLPQQGVNNAFGAVPGTVDALDPYFAQFNELEDPLQASASTLGSPAQATLNTAGAPTAAKFTSVAAPQNANASNPFADLSNVFPNLGGTNAAVSSAINSQLAGELSPEELDWFRDDQANFGVSSGMGFGSEMGANRTLRDLGLTRRQVMQQGLSNYNSTIPTIFNTQVLNPAIQAQLSQFNANEANQAAAQNAAAQNALDQFNSSAANQMALSNAQMANQLGMFNTGTQNDFAKANADILNQFNLYNTGQQNRANEINAAAQNQFALANANIGNDTNRLNAAIAAQNAEKLAAANPALKAAYERELFNEYMRNMANSGRPTPPYQGGIPNFSSMTGSPAVRQPSYTPQSVTPSSFGGNEQDYSWIDEPWWDQVLGTGDYQYLQNAPANTMFDPFANQSVYTGDYSEYDPYYFDYSYSPEYDYGF